MKTIPPLRVATDCSGIEAPLEALRQLNIPYTQIFRSDICPVANKLCELNYPKPEMEFGDLTKRNHSELAGLDVDLYVCGFPCQSFSRAGKKLGMADERAGVLAHVLETIKWLKPANFILENVKEFTTFDEGETFRATLNTLRSLGYRMFHQVLNTKDYGLPQNRQRVYIIGVLANDRLDKRNFFFPGKSPFEKPLTSFIDFENKTDRPFPAYIVNSFKEKLNEKPLPLMVASGRNYSRLSQKGIYPTITRSAQYIVNLRRRFTGKEALALQGFSPEFNCGDYKSSPIHAAAGNSMSICVIKKLIVGLRLHQREADVSELIDALDLNLI